jgi:hypothetical protein
LNAGSSEATIRGHIGKVESDRRTLGHDLPVRQYQGRHLRQQVRPLAAVRDLVINLVPGTEYQRYLELKAVLPVEIGPPSYRSVKASLIPRVTKAVAKARLIQVSTRGRDITWLRIAVANKP